MVRSSHLAPSVCSPIKAATPTQARRRTAGAPSGAPSGGTAPSGATAKTTTDGAGEDWGCFGVLEANFGCWKLGKSCKKILR